ncbi:serine O-acetyltransferase [Sulfitobacter sp.]|uniref:serine O-acetyltransferase n=1 Tax=Sulfitobacter sp. TaxID=1903071 RepID=UPI00300174BF
MTLETGGGGRHVFRLIKGDYHRHGRSVLDAAFVSLEIYRYGRWASQLTNPVARWIANKIYGVLRVFILNVTKVWIPPQVVIGDDFHIIHAEGMLSIHPDVVIGDRCGIMHNVTIGRNMGDGAPVIGDDVFIGVNSTVLGNIRIGDRVRIGANTAVSTNVPSDSTVIGSPARIYPRLALFGQAGSKPAARAQAQKSEGD